MKASGATSGWGHCQLGRLRPATVPSDSLGLLEVPPGSRRESAQHRRGHRGEEAVGKATQPPSSPAQPPGDLCGDLCNKPHSCDLGSLRAGAVPA